MAVLLAVMLAAGLPAVASWMFGKRTARQGADGAVAASLSGFRMQQTDRLQKLELMARVLATDSVLAGYLVETVRSGSPTKLLDLLEGYQTRLAFDVAAVLDPEQIVRAQVGVPIAAPDSLSAMLATVGERDRARGVWRDGDRLYQAAALPIVRDFELLGTVVVAQTLDDAAARQLASLGSDDVVFVIERVEGASTRVVAGTAAPQRAEALLDALARRGDVLPLVLQRGETVASVPLAGVEGDDLVAAIEPLRGADGRPVAALVAASSPARAAPGIRRLPLLALLGGLVAAVLGIGVALALAVRQDRPYAEVAKSAEAMSEGEDVAVPGLGGVAGRIGTALNRLSSDRRQQRSLSRAVSKAAQVAPSARKSAAGASARPESRDGAILATELRRFADPRLGYDPESNLERFTVDLRRLRAAVRDRRGRVIAVAGHRVVALFDGDDAVFRALAAGAEAMRALSEGESVFEQPDPPVMALTLGTMVQGPVAWGTGVGTALLGLPAQQTETLLREGAPGDICLAQPAYEALAGAFREAGVDRQAQRGVFSSQPLFTLQVEDAAAVTGLGRQVAVEPDAEHRRLSDIAAGMTLAGRFEILDELTADSHGVRFEVRDRERGVLAMLALLRPQLTADPESVERLATAFRRLRSLDHPHVVPVWDFGEAEGLPFILMPFVAGQRLRHVLAAGPLEPAAVLGMARQLAGGLAAGHGASVVHGDVRPEHLLIEGSGHLRIGGWAVGAGPPIDSAAAYTAPERAHGERAQGAAANQASDLYAAGATLYEALTGHPPFTGATPAEVLKQQLAGMPRAPGELVGGIPETFAAVIMQCLARDPGQRPATAAAVAEVLDTLRV